MLFFFLFLWQVVTASGVKIKQVFVGDISSKYQNGRTTVDVKVDSDSTVILFFSKSLSCKELRIQDGTGPYILARIFILSFL